MENNYLSQNKTKKSSQKSDIMHSSFMSGLVENKWILIMLLQSTHCCDVLGEAKEENSVSNSVSHRLVVRKERTWPTHWESLQDSPAVLGPCCPKSHFFLAGDLKAENISSFGGSLNPSSWPSPQLSLRTCNKMFLTD